jgi:4-amino-4-deoxy-L-arabinose transferase
LENNILTGFILIVICFIIYLKSFSFYKEEKFNATILCIMIAGLILRIYTSCDFFLHEWDERYHALVAKNLLDNPFKPMLYTQPILEYDYKSWSDNHIWVHKQPVPLYSMALSMFIFGINEIALRLPSIILSTASIWTTYKIGKLLFSEKTGLLAGFLFSINGLIIEQTAGRVATDHIDVFFFSFIGFAIYFLLTFSKNKNIYFFIVGAVFTSFAILSKWLPALIVLPIWVLSAQTQFKISSIVKYSLLFLTIVTVLVLPWQIYITQQFPLEAAWEYLYNRKHIFEALGPHGHPFYYHFDKMRIIFGELIYIPLLWMIYISLKDISQKNNLIILIWILIPYLFFSLVKTKMQGYILFTSPAIFIMTAFCFDYLWNINNKRLYFFKFIALMLFLLPVRYSIERIKPFSNIPRYHAWISKMKNLEKENEGKKVVVVNFKYAIEAMFYTNMVVYEKLPNTNEIEKLLSSGYKVYVDNWQQIPESIKNINPLQFTAISNP